VLALLVAGPIATTPTSAADDRKTEQESKPLIVCVVPATMPRADKTADGKPIGLDVALAEQLGRALERPIELHWCASTDCSWHCVRAGRCDVVLGQPLESGPPRDIAWSVPYAGAQFGLVVPSNSKNVHSLSDLRGKRLGIVAGTVAVSDKDHALARFTSREALLDAFGHQSLDAAFVDADFAAWYLHEHPKLGLRLVAEFVPREHWNVALAVRSDRAALLVELNRAIAQLAQAGTLKRIYQEVGIPYRTPFTAQTKEPPAADTWRRVRERGELVVSMDPANLPYSSAKGDRAGIDVELARTLAERLHVKLRIEWLDVQRETAVGKLLSRECDLVLGEAVEPNAVADDEELAGKILYSRPYYATGYFLVQRKDGPRAARLEELKGPGSQRLGTEAGSFADYRLRRQGYLRRLYRDQLATLKALDGRDIDFAYLWANVGWTLDTTPEFRLEIVPGFVPTDRWNIAAAMRKGDSELKDQVDRAFTSMIADGTVARVLARYHVPNFAPFSDAAQKTGSDDDVIHHGVADRGREPQLHRIQGSKKPYSGLERIRSAGELVVGLDQNNLPFSTAHPTPAGLDYEIARLLAEQLGVSLRVYWAYSTYDSYPSKLATKQLCDVILGITPDDRFGRRVLYSRPYYFAEFQFVVRRGEPAPAASDTLALEEGVAVRSLGQRTVTPFPSTEAILEAVASGRAQAGYVIATRGAWLAEERWPGKLAFLPMAETLDRFPISAAVRKADVDLKDAIDQAWDRLDRSGRLAQVFNAWHVPCRSPASRDAR
jgi:polar amino acid transport system substrate-binding protein